MHYENLNQRYKHYLFVGNAYPSTEFTLSRAEVLRTGMRSLLKSTVG
jgi:hypothetical protein